MKIAFVTVDLFPGREMLMPWRYVLENANVLNNAGHQVVVLNQQVQYSCENVNFKSIKTTNVARDGEQLVEYLNGNEIETLIYPLPLRETFKNQHHFNKLNCKKIAYMPGGIYAMRNVWRFMVARGIGAALPYLFDCLTPEGSYQQCLKKSGFSSFVGLTPLTSLKIKEAGFENSLTILPGKDDFSLLSEDSQTMEHFNLIHKKYYIYTGNAEIIRGTSLLASVFDEFAARNPDALLVFLLRNDTGTENEMLLKKLQQLTHHRQVLTITSRLSRNQMKSLIVGARGVLLPFIIIPSEIPLTFIEVMSTGIPIITMKNSGTTAYFNDAVLSAKSKGEFLNLMCKLWEDDSLFSQMKKLSRDKIVSHPSWEETGNQWNKLIQSQFT